MRKIILMLLFIVYSCSKSSEKPNFVFIYTDDQRFDTVGIIGDNQIITPNLDRLAQSGATMTHAYNMGAWHGAICVASRSMIISGKSVWRAKDQIDSPTSDKEKAISNSWPNTLRNNGYRT